MRTKLLCLIEVTVAFSLVAVLFRWALDLTMNTPLAHIAEGMAFPAYGLLLGAAVLLYALRCKPHILPIPTGKLRYQASLAGYGFFPVLVLSVSLNWIDWRQLPGAILIACLALLMLAWFAWMSRGRPAWKESLPIAGCLIPLLFASAAGDVFLKILYFFLFVGLAEETFFRGYIQTRLNQVFGQARLFFGIPWGAGLVVSSVFFGLWHLDPSAGFASLPHVLWTIPAGLLLGLVREKGRSVIAPAFLHGILNYGPQAVLWGLMAGG